jgi:hypothetical protein
MQLVLPRRIAAPAIVLSAVAFGSAAVGVSAASTRATAAITPQQTVIATLIPRPAGTLKPGATVSSGLGQRVFTDAKHGFTLANVGQAQYPAATTNGGKTWKTDGPALHLDAAQAPLSVSDLGATNRKTVFAFGGGQVIDATGNGGKQWFRATFDGLPMAVVGGRSGHLVAFIDASAGNGSKGVTWQYVSKNGGRTWRFDSTVGGS